MMLLVCLVLVASVVSVISLLAKNRSPNLSIGDQVTPVNLTTFDGENLMTGEMTGKVILINFWASWCDSCSSEAQILEQAWERYRDPGNVVFLGVDYKDSISEAKNYLYKYDILYPNGPDSNYQIGQALRLQGVPETYVIDRNGKLAYKKLGPFPSLEAISLVIDPLLK